MKRLLLLLIISTSFLTNAQVPSYVPTDGLVGWYSLESSLANSVNPSEVASGSATLLDSAAFFDNTELLLPNSSLPAEFSISFDFWVADLDVQGGQYPYLMGLDEMRFRFSGSRLPQHPLVLRRAMQAVLVRRSHRVHQHLQFHRHHHRAGTEPPSPKELRPDHSAQRRGCHIPRCRFIQHRPNPVGNGKVDHSWHIRRVGLEPSAKSSSNNWILPRQARAKSSFVPTDGLVVVPLTGMSMKSMERLHHQHHRRARPNRQASASLGFNGSAYGVLNNAGMPTGEFSVSAWVKQSQSWSTGNGIEFICVGSASNTAWGTIAGPEFIHLNRGRGCSGNGQVLSGVNFPLNEWVHLTYVCAGIGANADIYLNGEYAGQSLNLTSGRGASNLYLA